MSLLPITDVHTHNSMADPLTAVRNLRVDELPEWLLGSQPGRFSAGIHPWDAHLPFDKTLLERAVHDPRIWAVGECGLDKYAQAPLETQMNVFEWQINLAIETHKNIIIHCVKHWDALLQIKKQHGENNPDTLWIVHGFRGQQTQALQLINKGFYLSFNIHRDKDKTASLPPERCFFETD